MEINKGWRENKQHDEEQQVFHHLRNAFQKIIRQLFDSSDEPSQKGIYEAIQFFLKRIKGENSLTSEEKTEINQKFQELLEIEDPEELKHALKKLYCQYDKEGCNNLNSHSPQKSLI